MSILSITCAGALLAQFVSHVVGPGGQGDPGPIRYHLAIDWLLRDEQRLCIDGCPYPHTTAVGDLRQDTTACAREVSEPREVIHGHHGVQLSHQN